MDEDEDDSDALAEIERQKLFAATGWTAADECAFTSEIANPDGGTRAYTVDNDANNSRLWLNAIHRCLHRTSK